MVLGAGRRKAEDRIDHSAGVLLHKKLGEQVEEGEPIATMLTNRRDALDEARNMLSEAFSVSDVAAPVPDVILDPL